MTSEGYWSVQVQSWLGLQINRGNVPPFCPFSAGNHIGTLAHRANPAALQTHRYRFPNKRRNQRRVLGDFLVGQFLQVRELANFAKSKLSQGRDTVGKLDCCARAFLGWGIDGVSFLVVIGYGTDAYMKRLFKYRLRQNSPRWSSVKTRIGIDRTFPPCSHVRVFDKGEGVLTQIELLQVPIFYQPDQLPGKISQLVAAKVQIFQRCELANRRWDLGQIVVSQAQVLDIAETKQISGYRLKTVV